MAMMQVVNGETEADNTEDAKAWSQISESMQESFDAFTDAAESSVYSWIEWDIPFVSPFMGGLATLATKKNIPTATITRRRTA